MYIFQKVNMVSEDVQGATRSGKFYNGDEVAEAQDGYVVTVKELVDHEIYANTKDLNVFKLTAPDAVTDKISVMDYVGVSEADVVNVNYRVGDSEFCCYLNTQKVA